MKRFLLVITSISITLVISSCEKRQEMKICEKLNVSNSEGADHLIGRWKITDIAESKNGYDIKDSKTVDEENGYLTFRSTSEVELSHGNMVIFDCNIDGNEIQFTKTATTLVMQSDEEIELLECLNSATCFSLHPDDLRIHFSGSKKANFLVLKKIE